MKCACGCGRQIKVQPHHKYRPPRFLPGHHQRTKAFLATRAALIIKPPASWKIPSGTCECGCGAKTPIAARTRRAADQYCGYPLRFIHGHNTLGHRGKDARSWKGGHKRDALGYMYVWNPTSHLAYASGYVPEHRLVWEKANRRRLRAGEHVHHLDGNPSNNAPKNLVALKKADHYALHHASPLTRGRIAAAGRERYKDPAEREKSREYANRRWRKTN